jgi:hypothetical protein
MLYAAKASPRGTLEKSPNMFSFRHHEHENILVLTAQLQNLSPPLPPLGY